MSRDPEQAVFLRVERDLDGTPLAIFATFDADTFELDAEEVRQRITALRSIGRPVAEERRALAALAEGTDARP